jgi:hypothetical protein
MSQPQPPRVTFHLIGQDEAPIYYVTGISGNITPDGCIQVWMCQDAVRQAETQTANIDASGKPDLAHPVAVSLQQTPEEIHISRRVYCSVIMRPEQALEVAEWLQRNAQELRRFQATAAQPPNSNSDSAQQ